MQILKDWVLALTVTILVLIDIIILFIYTVVEGVRGNLNATLVPNEENFRTEIGVRQLKFIGQSSISN